VTAVIHEAAKNGDRSENGDYIYGKRRLREIDHRVRYLSKRLDEVNVVDRQPADTGKVYFGARVTVEDDSGESKCWRIVGADEIGARPDYISIDSPVAKALIGKRLDDEVTVGTGAGHACYVITEIRYER
jgi:transcription elongation factor GreB